MGMERRNDSILFAPCKYFIAYFDILGYESMITTDKDVAGVAWKIYEGIRTLKNESNVNNKDIQLYGLFDKDDFLIENYVIKHKLFSDNFFLCSKKNWMEILLISAKLQKYLITQGIFVRGSLCYGSLFFSEDFICGKGIISAYHIENKIAIYPRMVVDNSFNDGVTEQFDYPKDATPSQGLGHFKTDFDRLQFLNYLDVRGPMELGGYILPIYSKIVADTGILDIEYAFVQCHKEEIVKSLKINGNNLRVFEKYKWCLNYHNDFCEKRGFNELLIDNIDEFV